MTKEELEQIPEYITNLIPRDIVYQPGLTRFLRPVAPDHQSSRSASPVQLHHHPEVQSQPQAEAQTQKSLVQGPPMFYFHDRPASRSEDHILADTSENRDARSVTDSQMQVTTSDSVTLSNNDLNADHGGSCSQPYYSNADVPRQRRRTG